jgi:hypothetical protein
MRKGGSGDICFQHSNPAESILSSLLNPAVTFEIGRHELNSSMIPHRSSDRISPFSDNTKQILTLANLLIIRIN